MSNQEKLKNYLLGNDEKKKVGYLKDSISNGKVIMLSGKWGSGKTYFWQKEIMPFLNKKEFKIPNHYISLYGKTSIDEIKSEIFLKVFESVDSFESEEKTKNIVKGTVDTVLSLANSISVFGMSLDLSKVSDNTFEKIDSLLENEKLKRTENYFNKGAIICLDDFERKSKDIDLNDLFGFITQLTLNFKCKVVIILNDEVFQNKEKDIFSRVKEKTVSKFLKYEPSTEELFNSIFKDKYKILEYKKDFILGIFNKTQELNARMYEQVLENLVEYISAKLPDDEFYLHYLILKNFDFLINHEVIHLSKENDVLSTFDKIDDDKMQDIKDVFNRIPSKNVYRKNYPVKDTLGNARINHLSDNEINSIYFSKMLQCYYYNGIDKEIIEKINNFIETGILIDE